MTDIELYGIDMAEFMQDFNYSQDKVVAEITPMIDNINKLKSK
tara:strand:- start:76 stop:204 length:129 start_codon:yes stop_codon:yes gene_type:complete